MRTQRKTGLVQGEYKPINASKYKGKWPIYYRSSWEKRLCSFFDCNDNVIKWTSESIIVPYYNPITQRTHRYYPDFSVEYYDQDGVLIKEIIEVKPERDAAIAEGRAAPPARGKRQSVEAYMRQMATHVKNTQKWDAAKVIATKMGYKFRVVSEKDMFGK